MNDILFCKYLALESGERQIPNQSCHALSAFPFVILNSLNFFNRFLDLAFFQWSLEELSMNGEQKDPL